MVSVPGYDVRTFFLVLVSTVLLQLRCGGHSCVSAEVNHASIVKMGDNVRELLIFQHTYPELVCYPLLQYTCHNDLHLVCPDNCDRVRTRHFPSAARGDSVMTASGPVNVISQSGRITAHYNSTNLVCLPMLTHTCTNDRHLVCPENCFRHGAGGAQGHNQERRRRRRKKRNKRSSSWEE